MEIIVQKGPFAFAKVLDLDFDILDLKLERSISSQMAQIAAIILTEAQKQVPIDTGTLHKSRFMSGPEVKDDVIKVRIGYGDENGINWKNHMFAHEYMVTVHEDLMMRHAKGRKAKFLEDPCKAYASLIVSKVMEIFQGSLWDTAFTPEIRASRGNDVHDAPVKYSELMDPERMISDALKYNDTEMLDYLVGVEGREHLQAEARMKAQEARQSTLTDEDRDIIRRSQERDAKLTMAEADAIIKQGEAEMYNRGVFEEDLRYEKAMERKINQEEQRRLRQSKKASRQEYLKRKKAQLKRGQEDYENYQMYVRKGEDVD